MKVRRLVLLPMMIVLFTLWLHFADAEQLAPNVLPLGVGVKPVLEASLGAPPPLGWKWQI